MILVVGASGWLGRFTVRRLLDAGERVRAASRDRRKLEALQALGAEAVQADLVDPSSLAAACAGADAVFVAAHSLTGTGTYASEAVDDAGHRALIDAAKREGVARFVYTSAMFASPDHRVDFMRTKARIEVYLAQSGLSFAILRPSAFMEWHVHEFIGRPLIETGKATIFGPGTNPLNFVAAADVAAVAAEAIVARETPGAPLEIGGPDNVTRNEVAAMYGALRDSPITLRHVPLALLRSAAPLVRPFRPVIARLMSVAVWSETSDQTFDFDARPRGGARPTTGVRDFIASRLAAARSDEGMRSAA